MAGVVFPIRKQDDYVARWAIFLHLIQLLYCDVHGVVDCGLSPRTQGLDGVCQKLSVTRSRLGDECLLVEPNDQGQIRRTARYVLEKVQRSTFFIVKGKINRI